MSGTRTPLAVPRVTGPAWDERRNTSRVFAAPPDALPAALRAMQALRRDQPELVRWLEEGHPPLTHDEHFARFGEHYRATLTRRREAVQATKGKAG